MSNAHPSSFADPPRKLVLEVAADIGCDPRLAAKILRLGPSAARNRFHRERAAEVLARLGWPTATTEASS